MYIGFILSTPHYHVYINEQTLFRISSTTCTKFSEMLVGTSLTNYSILITLKTDSRYVLTE